MAANYVEDCRADHDGAGLRNLEATAMLSLGGGGWGSTRLISGLSNLLLGFNIGLLNFGAPAAVSAVGR